jgi:hypothetical protein
MDHELRITHHASRITPHSAVALVITLVLLSIITFMTVTFLVVSRSQHGAVATETDRAIARLAADTARDRAIAELLAPIMASTNEFDYGLLVSTNYINAEGFDQTIPVLNPPVINPTNVNYDYTGAIPPQPLSDDQWKQNIANLLYNPRPPVFITTNAAGSNEFRFFVDWNRNQRDDPNGLQPVISSDPLNPYYNINGTTMPAMLPGLTLSNFFVGDPEWIGGLQRPEFAHSANNLFTHRYAYLVVPAGQTLDLNTIHNAAKRLGGSGDGFFRNQGVLTAEMNLAAFLVDLNTNLWPYSTPNQYSFPGYSYSYDLNVFNAGAAFDDAAALLRWRYNGTWKNLASVANLLPAGVNPFHQDFIDGYCAGPLMTNTWWPVTTDADDATRTSSPWSGADNPNHFYTPQDLFDQVKSRPLIAGGYSFSDRLWMAGTNNDSYNRYTFSRLLCQLGTDSAPEPGGKMNLNYCNVDNNGYVVPNKAATFTPWQATNFFMNAAIRLLADAGYTVGDATTSTSNLLVRSSVPGSTDLNIPITNLNIPIWPTNFYTPSVHRLLQLAANMYDATTNRVDLVTIPPNYPYLPTIFQPVFGVGSTGQIFIIRYQEVIAADTRGLVFNATPPHDLSDPRDRAVKPLDMVYGIPLVVGAKKGFPNFNKLAMQMQVQVTRKLQFHRPQDSTTEPVNEIDQMFVVGISNSLGVEAWNSYLTAFPREIQMVVWPDISVLLTNLDTGKWVNQPPLWSRYRLLTPVITNIAANTWPGYDPSQASYSFQIPLATNLVFLTNSTYRQPPVDGFVPLTGIFERPGGTNFYLPPHWELIFKPRLRFAMVDRATQRILDYVNLADNTPLDVANTLYTNGNCGATYTQDGGNGSMWCTNRMYGAPSTATAVPTFGINNQIEASMGHITADWTSSTHEFPPGMDQAAAIAFFRGQFIPGYQLSSNSFNAPYQPFRNIYLLTTWEANDPLVHYTVGDLKDLVPPSLMVDKLNPMPKALGELNARYEPWGGAAGRESSPTIMDLKVKDPLMLQSDYWDFPTNKFPNAGWLGRVHRGTPWQTVYLKPSGIDVTSWKIWTGNGLWVTNIGQTTLFPLNYGFFDASVSQPTNDWHLLDLFTAALNDNATRGQLSINQTNLAAWSAVLSGVIVLTNNLDADGTTPITDPTGNPIPGWLPIQPAGVYDALNPATWPPIVRIVKSINDVRATNNTRHVFSRLSDLLAVPELTINSPFINTNGTPDLWNHGLNDAAYERLPQQIAGLLKADSVPRFVIYAFGQTLKPESTRAIVKSGTFAGLCTNYQIVAESATRTVVRFEGAQPFRGGTLSAITNLHPVIESFNVLPPD